MTSANTNSSKTDDTENSSQKTNFIPELYARAGITDLAEFYATKFASTEILDARYFRPLDRFDMHFARTLWIYDNVRAGSTLLDIGCGVGMLALLTRKNVRLSGIDISDECAAAAKRNGYTDTRRGELTNLPFADASFDYVASLDVIGHVAFEEKDRVISEIRRVLKPDGVTLHGIEANDGATYKNYDEMTPDELRRFIEIDGHVGLETSEAHAARFGRFFKHVLFEPRYILCLSSEEFLKQADGYGLSFDADFLDYLRGLSNSERRAFDMAMGYVFNKVSDLHIKLPLTGFYTLLKASNAELGAFYNEHRDRKNLVSSYLTETGKNNNGADYNERKLVEPKNISIDFTPNLSGQIRTEFDDGWHAPDDFPPVGRWMRERSRIRFKSPSVSSVSLDLMTHLPNLDSKFPVEVRFLLNGVQIGGLSLFRYGWLELKFGVPETLRSAPNDVFELTIYADRTFQPRPDDAESRDDRQLSVAVCNIQIKT